MEATSESRSYVVEGMTCGHCRTAVIEEISAIEGVEDVAVELESGRTEIRGRFADAQVRAAVEEAGYELGADR